MEKLLIKLTFRQQHFYGRPLRLSVKMICLEEQCSKVFEALILLNKNSLFCLLRM